MKTIKKIHKAIKVIAVIGLGFIKPVHSISAPDSTTYRCTRKGIKSSYGLETWKEVFADFKDYVKE